MPSYIWPQVVSYECHRPSSRPPMSHRVFCPLVFVLSAWPLVDAYLLEVLDIRFPRLPHFLFLSCFAHEVIPMQGLAWLKYREHHSYPRRFSLALLHRPTAFCGVTHFHVTHCACHTSRVRAHSHLTVFRLQCHQAPSATCEVVGATSRAHVGRAGAGRLASPHSNACRRFHLALRARPGRAGTWRWDLTTAWPTAHDDIHVALALLISVLTISVNSLARNARDRPPPPPPPSASRGPAALKLYFIRSCTSKLRSLALLPLALRP